MGKGDRIGGALIVGVLLLEIAICVVYIVGQYKPRSSGMPGQQATPAILIPDTTRGMQRTILAGSVIDQERLILRRYLASRKVIQRFEDWMRGGRRSFAYLSDLKQALRDRQAELAYIETLSPDPGFERFHVALKEVLAHAVRVTGWAVEFVKSRQDPAERWAEFMRVSDNLSRRLSKIKGAYVK